MNSEVEKLKNRLFNDPTKKVTNFHVTWGPEAEKMTVEERAKCINDVLDEVESGRARLVNPSEWDF